MKKRICFMGLALSLLAFGTITGVVASQGKDVVMTVAESEEEPAAAPATVSLPKIDHGSVEANILEGEVGNICVLDVSHDLFYVVESVSVNGTALVEDENISRRYSFALSEGENVVAISIAVDKQLLGTFATMYGEFRDKDWTHLLSVDNIVTIVKWVFDCGILLVIARYFIRDKRLASKVTASVENKIDKVIPETTRQAVLKTMEEVITPIFTQLKADNIDITNALSVFAKCIALSQEDTPESKTAILDLLSQLKISDEKTLAEIKAYIDRIVAEHIKNYNDTLATLDKISSKNKEIAGIEEQEEPAAPAEEPVAPAVDDDGTSI